MNPSRQWLWICIALAGLVAVLAWFLPARPHDDPTLAPKAAKPLPE